jgi:hypothetical protein
MSAINTTNTNTNTNTNNTTGGLFVPHVFPSISEDKIRDVFSAYGTIKNVHFMPKVGTDGRNFNAVFINFNEWNEKPETNNLLDELASNGKVHVYYDEKWYWIVLFNTSKKSKDDDANKENRPPKVLTKPPAPLPQIPEFSPPQTPPPNNRHIPTTAAWGAPKKAAKSNKKPDIELGGGAATAAMEAEAESLIPEEDFSLVDADYVYKLEEDNKNLTEEIRRLIAQQENYMNLFKQQAMVIATLCPPATATFNQNAF